MDRPAATVVAADTFTEQWSIRVAVGVATIVFFWLENSVDGPEASHFFFLQMFIDDFTEFFDDSEFLSGHGSHGSRALPIFLVFKKLPNSFQFPERNMVLHRTVEEDRIEHFLIELILINGFSQHLEVQVFLSVQLPLADAHKVVEHMTLSESFHFRIPHSQTLHSISELAFTLTQNPTN